MIHRPDLHHKFVLLFDIKNANPLDLSFLGSAHQLLRDVRYGLVPDEAIKKALNQYFQRNESLPVLDQWPIIEHVYATKGGRALCQAYYNLRLFGAAHPSGRTLLPSPVRFSLARSIDPIFPLAAGHSTAYGLYRMHGCYHPTAGLHNGVSASDLQLLWKGLSKVFVSDASSQPVEVSIRGLWIFSHEAQPISAKELFGLVQTPALKFQAAQFANYSISSPPPGRLEAIPNVFLARLV
ncbi:type I CRISPR-associated protein Cas7 [Meiothermus taiwanensis]|jgi:CRISPR-associated protein Csd2|uniref:CRISPR-associated protein Cas7/Csd2, subtype I-C/DVULG n=2 Tax=Meiothermus taiwanensis TaxID=172827 RepID=A0A399DSD6_9DEIN|nr:type I CRISPR-associated protein Cas7 [Meiothermus taiwanensis]AWR87567.1 hypothetical protein Mtai_v1c23360 [Meiothermus taiwanensis WR-220]KIQ53590.1 hypothetical protein SY28_13110 [Meiothermus taiwanensis]KZK16360.1 hypothetical protein A3962_06410 [Meiothermus taiwanensis]RIH74996.1 CRISPR-associated protein Cas7/Csd2, subtype I-C/DVULG [Meiothermus taiwanensis]